MEVNPETVDDALAGVLAARGCRVSLGAQSLDAGLLAVLERRATPEACARPWRRCAPRASTTSRSTSSTASPARAARTSMATSTGARRWSPTTSPATSSRPSPARASRTATAPSWRARPSCSRITTSTSSTGCRRPATAGTRRPASRGRPRAHEHNCAYWTGRDYLGIGIGAVSTLGLERRTNRPSLAGFIDALERGEEPPRSIEQLSAEERARERLLLGLRLDVPLATGELEHAIDPDGLERMVGLGLIEAADGTLRLTTRGRLLANDVVSSVIA